MLKFSIGGLVILARAIASASVAGPIAAAEFEVLRMPEFDNVIISMKGEVVRSDAASLAELIESLDGAHATLNVQGPGGLVDEALDIGAQVNMAGYATMVSAQTECFSACALIWLAGVRRYLAPDSVIGVHAAYQTDEAGVPSESGVANADIGFYLGQVGLPRDAIRYVATASPDAFLPITPLIARNLGIEVHEQRGTETITPDEAPTAHLTARKVSELGVISVECADLMSLDKRRIRQTMEGILQQGHDTFGGERMGEVISWMRDQTRAEAKQAGLAGWCIDAAAKMTGDGVDIDLRGPAFDCAKAGTAGERTICGDVVLWASDRALAGFYGIFRDVTESSDRERLVDSQKSWIVWRESCGTDTACIRAAYDQRLSDLGDPEGWSFRY